MFSYPVVLESCTDSGVVAQAQYLQGKRAIPDLLPVPPAPMDSSPGLCPHSSEEEAQHMEENLLRQQPLLILIPLVTYSRSFVTRK